MRHMPRTAEISNCWDPHATWNSCDWQILATDLFSLNGTNYLLIVDYYSKYPLIRRLREFSSMEVISFLKQIFAKQGVPERLVSDNSSHFSSQHFKKITKALGLWDIISSPRYPQLNSIAKHCVQTIKAAMRKTMLSNQDINMSLLCFWSTPIDHVIRSPGELPFNRKLVSNLLTKCMNQNIYKVEIQSRLITETVVTKETTWQTC